MEQWRKHGYAPATIAVHRTYLKQLLRYLVDCGAPAHIARSITRAPYAEPRTVIAEEGEIEKLRASAPKIPRARWLPCFLEIIAGHGLRFTEAKKLCAAHYNPTDHTIKYMVKGRRFNQLPATQALQEFFRTAPPSDDPHKPLLERFHRKPVHEKAMRKKWKALLLAAGVNPNLNPHDLRRTIAVRSLDSTGDMRVPQQILGHENLATTGKYLMHRNPEKIRPLLEQLNKFTPAAPAQPARFQN